MRTAVKAMLHTQRSTGAAAGFSLVELLLAFGLGLSLVALLLQAVMAEGQNGQRLARVLRERQLADRALALLRSDLQRATVVASSAGPVGEAAACSLAGRAVLLHLETPAGPITYSAGRAPEPIWRGTVLMRCGPAFGLDGTPSSGKPLNRVLLDGLAADGAQVVLQAPGALRVELHQVLPVAAHRLQSVRHRRLLPMPSSV